MRIKIYCPGKQCRKHFKLDYINPDPQEDMGNERDICLNFPLPEGWKIKPIYYGDYEIFCPRCVKKYSGENIRKFMRGD